MAMFDEVESEVPLPDGYTGELQTKSFACILTTLLIRRDGRLLIKDQQFEKVPLAERPFPNHPKKRFFGMIRVSSEIWRDLNFDGEFEFYGYDDNSHRSHDYIARFKHGQLECIKAVPPRRRHFSP